MHYSSSSPGARPGHFLLPVVLHRGQALAQSTLSFEKKKTWLNSIFLQMAKSSLSPP